MTERSPSDGPCGAPARILAAACDLFGDLGYHEANLRAIGKAAGLDPALVIRHFDSKGRLFIVALRSALPDGARPACIERLTAAARLLLASRSAPKEIRRSAMRTLRHALDQAGDGRAQLRQQIGAALCLESVRPLLAADGRGEASAAEAASRLLAEAFSTAPAGNTPGP